MWNGAALALKPRPTMIRAMPVSSSTPCGVPVARAMRSNSSWPVAPYTSAEPYSRNAAPTDPMIRYLSAPSTDGSDSVSIATSTYSAIENSSSATKRITRLLATASSDIPAMAARSSALYSTARSAMPPTEPHETHTATSPAENSSMRAPCPKASIRSVWSNE
jgi:hypothetical protein